MCVANTTLIGSNRGFAGGDRATATAARATATAPPPRQQRMPSPPRPRLQPHELARFLAETNERCGICDVVLEITQRLTSLRCSHLFHAQCITQWVRAHRTGSCPICGPNT